jgi:hypothetical protein
LAVDLHRIPADVIRMQVGADNGVDLFSTVPGRLEVF